MKKKAILLLTSIALLLGGLFLYLLFNDKAYISRVLSELIPIQTIKKQSLAIIILSSFGADLFWSMSFTMIVQFIVWFKKRKTYLLCVCSLLGIVYELMQCFGIVPGTADVLDGIIYILGSLFAILIIQGGKLYEEE